MTRGKKTESDNRERVERGQTRKERSSKRDKRGGRLVGVSRKGRRRWREGRWKKRLI